MNHITTSTPPTWEEWRDALLDIVEHGFDKERTARQLAVVRSAPAVALRKAALCIIDGVMGCKGPSFDADDAAMGLSADLSEKRHDLIWKPDEKRPHPVAWFLIGWCMCVISPFRDENGRLPAAIVARIRAALDALEQKRRQAQEQQQAEEVLS